MGENPPDDQGVLDGGRHGHAAATASLGLPSGSSPGRAFWGLCVQREDRQAPRKQHGGVRRHSPSQPGPDRVPRRIRGARTLIEALTGEPGAWSKPHLASNPPSRRHRQVCGLGGRLGDGGRAAVGEELGVGLRQWSSARHSLLASEAPPRSTWVAARRWPISGTACAPHPAARAYFPCWASESRSKTWSSIGARCRKRDVGVVLMPATVARFSLMASFVW